MDRKNPKFKKLEASQKDRLTDTLRELPRPKLSRPFGHKAAKQGDSRLAARLEKLLGLSQKQKRDTGLRLATTALSTLNLLIGSDQVQINKKQAKRSVGKSVDGLSSATTAWMLRTFLAFLRAAGPETLITQVTFNRPKRQRRDDREDLHPLAGAKRGLQGEHQATIYSGSEFYRRDAVARLYK